MIRVAVVGAGQMARRVYLPVLAARDDVELAALVEPDGPRRRSAGRMYRFGREVASVSELKAGEADCALLLTREQSRREPLTGLMELGLDVLSEKPMAANLAEAEEFVALAEEHQRILMIGFNRRFMPAYVRAKQFVGDRPVKAARVWKHGANVWGHSLHVVDVLRWFCGEPVHTRAEGNFDDAGHETTVAAVVRFHSSAVGVFESSRDYGMRKDELEVHGEGFTVRVYAPDTVIMYENGNEVTYRHGKDTWFTEGVVHFGFAQQVDHFLKAVADRTTPVNAAAEAIKSHRLAAEIVRALRTSSP